MGGGVGRGGSLGEEERVFSAKGGDGVKSEEHGSCILEAVHVGGRKGHE